MPIYTIGSTDIEYTVERKENIERRYIEIMPDRILVTVSDQDNDDDVQSFLNRKERWLYENAQKVRELAAKSNNVHRFVSGVKIPYRGRRMNLTITRKSTPEVEVKFQYGFIVALPDYVCEDSQDKVVESALRLWMKGQVKKDVKSIVARYAHKYGLAPRDIRIKDQKHIWGSCSRDGVINFNWHLVFAPKAVLEYAVLHELCHLRYRSHCANFWMLVNSLMPDYLDRKDWLDKNENLMILNIRDIPI